MKFVVRILLLVTALLSLALDGARAELATGEEAERVCTNWLASVVHARGSWAGEVRPSILFETSISANDTLLAYRFDISPRGFVVVPALKELGPVRAFSEEYQLDSRQDPGFGRLLREDLHQSLRGFVRVYGSLSASLPSGLDVSGRETRAAWDRYALDPKEYGKMLDREPQPTLSQGGPLLMTSWNQGPAYNNFCPPGAEGNCWVGCVATAAAQIMRFHQWPPAGAGSHAYHWNGDPCNGFQGAGTLSADFTDSYDWQHMPEIVVPGSPLVEQDAVAELSYEVGVALETNYGSVQCGSGSNIDNTLSMFPTYFRYSDSIERENRSDYTQSSWFAMIQAEIDQGRPMQYFIAYDEAAGHSIVCDGYREIGSLRQYHINYGWGGPFTCWYDLDNIYHSADSTQEVLIRSIRPQNNVIPAGATLQDTRWFSGEVYHVMGSVTVASGATLTIEPGAIVKMAYQSSSSSKTCITVYGTLLALGTVSAPIYFTSDRDDSVGGDTNGDGGANPPAAGDWGYIKFAGPGSVVDHCVVRYGGYAYLSPQFLNYLLWAANSQLDIRNSTIEYGYERGIYVDGTSPQLYGNTIDHVSSYGIYCQNGSPLIQGNTIRNCSKKVYYIGGTVNMISNVLEGTGAGDYGLYMVSGASGILSDNTIQGGTYGLYLAGDTLSVSGGRIEGTTYPVTFNGDGFARLTDGTYTGNANQAIAVVGSISKNRRWPVQLGGQLPYLVLSGAEFGIGTGDTLSIDPGVVVKLQYMSGYNNKARVTVSGTLLALGTVSAPIYFTSDRDDSVGGDTNGDGGANPPAAGDWGYIKFAGPGSVVDHCVVRYGGYAYLSPQFLNYLLWAANSQLDIRNSTIEYGYERGIYVDGTSPQLYGNTIDHVSSYGIYCQNGSPLIQGNTIRNCSKKVYYIGGTVNMISNVLEGTGAGDYGLYMVSGASGILSDNTIQGGTYGLYLAGDTLSVSGGRIEGTTYPVTFNGDGFARLTDGTYTGNANQAIAVVGSISKNRRWPVQLGGQLPYLVLSGAEFGIGTGDTLSIDPGVVVKLQYMSGYNNKARVTVSGTLLALGTVSAPIYFTSDRDDSVGGDTNGDGGANPPAAGDWGYIKFAGPGSVVDHCVVRYGGYAYLSPQFLNYLLWAANSQLDIRNSTIEYGYERGIYVDGTSPQLYGNTIDHVSSYGIYCQNGSPLIQGNTIRNCSKKVYYIGGTVNMISNVLEGTGAGDYGLYMVSGASGILSDNTIQGGTYGLYLAGDTLSVSGGRIEGTTYPVTFNGDGFARLTDGTYTGNANQAIAVVGSISKNRRWPVQLGGQLPYLVLSGAEFGIGTGDTLSIDPGVVVKLQYMSGYNNKARVTVSGTLLALGTVSAPIYFTSDRDDSVGGDTNGDGGANPPAAGDWGYIKFAGPGSVVDHCVVRYGGYAYLSPQFLNYLLWAANSQLDIRNSTIEYGYERGIYVDGTSPQLYGNTIDHVSSYGIYCQNGSPLIQGNTIRNCSMKVYYNGGTVNMGSNVLEGTGAGDYGLYMVSGASGILSDNTIQGGTYGLYLAGDTLSVSGGRIEGTTYPVTFSGDGFARLTDGTYTGNANQAIAVVGSISKNRRWPVQLGGQLPYLVRSGAFGIGTGDTLSIDPGVVVKLQYTSDYYSKARLTVSGTLLALGTASAPIYFTSDRDDSVGGDTNGDGGANPPAAGDWGDIRLDGSGTSLEHCTVRYGGGYVNTPDLIRIGGSQNTVDGCLLTNVPQVAISGSGCRNTVITGNRILSAYQAIYIDTSPTGPDLSSIYGNQITNGQAGIIYYGSYTHSVASICGNEITGTNSGVGIVCGNLASTEISGNTIEGCPTAISVQGCAGSVQSNTLRQTGSPTGTIGVQVNGPANLAMNTNTITGFQYGLKSIENSSSASITLEIEGNNIIDNPGYGIYLGSSNPASADGPSAVIHSNNIYGNSLYNLYLGPYANPSTTTINTENNWWGTTDPLMIAGSIHDHGDDPLSPIADFDPWLSEPVVPSPPQPRIWVAPQALSVELLPFHVTEDQFRIGNRGVESLSFSITEAASPPPPQKTRPDQDSPDRVDVPWIMEEPTNGVVPSWNSLPVTVEFGSGSLPDSTYKAYLLIQSDDPLVDLVVLPVTMQVSHAFVRGPAPGDTLGLGDPVQIDWTTYHPDEVATIDLFYSTDAGRSFPHQIAENLPNTPPYTWIVSGAGGDSCRILLVAHYLDGSRPEDTSDGFFTIRLPSSVGPSPDSAIDEACLHESHPNPFSRETRITFDLPRRQRTTLEVFAVTGRSVRRLIDEQRGPGRCEALWDATDKNGRKVASGIYLFRLRTEDKTWIRRMVLTR